MASTEDRTPQPVASGVTRRLFLKHIGAATLAADALAVAKAKAADDNGQTLPADAVANRDGIIKGETAIVLTINGKSRQVKVEPRTTLLSALRDRLEPALTGPKLVCDAGTCGACTVLLDGKSAYGCSLLAIDMVGRQITTVEGLGQPGNLSVVQAAFCEKD
ncbi:MAG: (2Fe-2S)-binding protein, partial [Phycisphaerales bacterium]|nr:(2Fe-2S)-binding protein [Phycisphaerales bacterium]